MPSAQARIRTGRASRYLKQLCSHTARIGAPPHGRQHDERGAMVTPRRARCSDTDGLIEFDRGRCTLSATGEELVLLAEADDEQHLRLIRDAIADRLHRIGRRDQLSLIWTPAV